MADSKEEKKKKVGQRVRAWLERNIEDIENQSEAKQFDEDGNPLDGLPTPSPTPKPDGKKAVKKKLSKSYKEKLKKGK